MRFPVLHVPFMRPNGMALFPFILVRRAEFKKDRVLINHEKIHLWQQVEMLIAPFYALYLLHYIFNLLKCQNHYTAYMNIVFEKEAYAKETDLDYLKKRKLFGWTAFL